MTVSEQGSPSLPATLTVVGGAGFLGRALIGWLAGDRACAGMAVRCLDRAPYPESAARPQSFTQLVGDACDPDLLARALTGADAVWIRAGILGGAPSVDVSRCRDYLDVNVGIVAAALDACAVTGCHRVLFDSSGQVFGDAADAGPSTPAAEPTACNFYGASKLIAEKLLRPWALLARAGESRSVQVMRYPRVHAPDSRDVIHAMVGAALAGQPIRIIGTVSRRIDFVHVDDVVSANLAALRRAPRFAVYHVSADRPVALFELALLVQNLVARRRGVRVPIERVPGDTASLPFEPHTVGLRWEESIQELGLAPPRGLENMVEETIARQL